MNVTIFLDLFHAVQRISRTIPKRSKNYHDCLKDLSFCFRRYGDIGSQRSLPTPSPSDLTHNLDAFVTKWKQHLTNKTVANLKCHARKGCLSEILPSLGTNRNEALHR